MTKLEDPKTEILKSIGRDEVLNSEIQDMLSSSNGSLPIPIDDGEAALPGISTEEFTRASTSAILSGGGNGIGEDRNTEAIIRAFARPVIRIRHNKLVEADIPTSTLRGQLEPHMDTINTMVQSVGRIEINGHRRFSWVGTGWVIDEDIIVTNRHVARTFAHHTGTTYSFRPGVFGTPMEANIDFFEEDGNSGEDAFRFSNIPYIEPEGGPDLAFVQVKWGDDGIKRNKVGLSGGDFDSDKQIAVIGYPAKDSRTRMPEEMDRIFGNKYNVKRFSPGYVIASSDRAGLLTHDCTTLGGNSGSVVLDLENGEAIALHYGGREEEANYAVLASVINDRLNEVKRGSAFTGYKPTDNNEVTEEIPEIESLADRQGYDPEFLGITVDLPCMPDSLREDLAPVTGNENNELKYMHYSVFMNAKRRVASYVVVNIDGNQLHGIPRGSDKWYFDPRIDRAHQVGNDLYKHNPLDRGHLTRRLDPSWGANRSIASQGIEDTFFYTNCAPQHMALNRRAWLGLEDHILNNAEAHDLKLIVFTGPVFRSDDQEYRNIKIPNEFWKVVAMIKSDGEEDPGELSITGYVLSQRSLVDNLEFVFGEHQSYQVTVRYIEDLTSLDFGKLKNHDPLEGMTEEDASHAGFKSRGRRLSSFKDIEY